MQTATKQLIVERTYNAPIEKVWKAITDKDQMKEWYFDISDFKAEKGFEFVFTAGSEGKKFEHHCKVIEVIPPTKLSYSWRYAGYAGNSVVTFELFEEDNNTTRVQLTHTGLESFPDQPEFAVAGFTEGWNFILGKSLPEFLKKDQP